MKSGKSFSKSSGRKSIRKISGGKGGTGKKSFDKSGGYPKKFSTTGGASKSYAKRDDGDRKPYSDHPSSFKYTGHRKEFKKQVDKKFSSSRAGSKPFSKRDDRVERPVADRPSSFKRTDNRKDFKKPVDKKFSSPRSGSKPFSKRDDRVEKPFSNQPSAFGRSDDKADFNRSYEKKNYGERSKPFVRKDDRDKKPYRDRSDDKKGFVKYGDKKFSEGRSSSFSKRDDGYEKPSRNRSEDKRDFKKPYDKKFSSGQSRPFVKRSDQPERQSEDHTETFHISEDGNDFVKRVERPNRRRSDKRIPGGENKPRSSASRFKETSKSDFNMRKSFAPNEDENASDATNSKWNRKSGHEFYGDKKSFRQKRNDRKPRTESYQASNDGSIRLNKYISNSGICSRREADELIAAGVVSVNGVIMTELGYKVKLDDEVKYNNETLRTEKLMYILVNKPKDFITTVEDPQDRKTVMWLIRDACRERVYPVGRLDRNTTGVLLFTNDGELAKKLTHPSFEIQKIYQVELDSPLKSSDMEKIKEGVTLEDGYIKVDDLAYSSAGQDKSVVGVEIHSGRNRIVRRLFEHFGYVVKKLDRVYFAGLSKKDLPRGRWRFLTSLEVSNLKMMTGNKKMQKYFEA
jgi:23S rRNA pseudouridine2605 synthase